MYIRTLPQTGTQKYTKVSYLYMYVLNCHTVKLWDITQYFNCNVTNIIILMGTGSAYIHTYIIICMYVHTFIMIVRKCMCTCVYTYYDGSAIDWEGICAYYHNSIEIFHNPNIIIFSGDKCVLRIKTLLHYRGIY